MKKYSHGVKYSSEKTKKKLFPCKSMLYIHQKIKEHDLWDFEMTTGIFQSLGSKQNKILKIFLIKISFVTSPFSLLF